MSEQRFTVTLKQIIDEFKLTEQKKNEKENKNGKLGNVQEVL